MPVNDSFHIYDTTLRDGAQQEGLNLSVHDKLNIARHLDELGVGFIEGGWPGANPKDTEFFALAKKELKLKNATFVAFGATRRPDAKAADDVLLGALRDSGAPAVTLVAKAFDRHVDLALKTTLDENLAMIRDSVTHLIQEGQRVFLDAEHFFDGYRSNRAYALEVVRVAAEAGAEAALAGPRPSSTTRNGEPSFCKRCWPANSSSTFIAWCSRNASAISRLISGRTIASALLAMVTRPNRALALSGGLVARSIFSTWEFFLS